MRVRGGEREGGIESARLLVWDRKKPITTKNFRIIKSFVKIAFPLAKYTTIKNVFKNHRNERTATECEP